MRCEFTNLFSCPRCNFDLNISIIAECTTIAKSGFFHYSDDICFQNLWILENYVLKVVN